MMVTMESEKNINPVVSGLSGLFTAVAFLTMFGGLSYIGSFIVPLFLITLVSSFLGVFINKKNKFIPAIVGIVASLLICAGILFRSLGEI